VRKEIAEIIPPHKVFVGHPDAKLILTEFGEYENDDCAEANEVVKKLLKEFEGDIKFNFRHFPLINFHQHSHKASEAAVAAAQEGKFWEMHNILFENRYHLGTISLKEYANISGLTDKNFLNKMIDSCYAWTVRADLLEALNKGLKNVLVFYINGEKFNKKPSFNNLRAALELALKKSGKKVAGVNGKI
jgi:protein-disulfide isomerase